MMIVLARESDLPVILFAYTEDISDISSDSGRISLQREE
jgi:hypothetical protein